MFRGGDKSESQAEKNASIEIIHISGTSPNHINAMDMSRNYGDGTDPIILKSEFVLSL